MSLSEKDIDKLFQQMDGKASLEYKDAYWTEMEQLLNTQQRKRGFVWWLNGWLLIPAGLLLATVTAMGFSMRKTVIPTEIVKNTPVTVESELLVQNSNIHTASIHLESSSDGTNHYSAPIKQQEITNNTGNNSYANDTRQNSKNTTPLEETKELVNSTNKSTNENNSHVTTKKLEQVTLDAPIASAIIATVENDTVQLQDNTTLETDVIAHTSTEENSASILDKGDKMKQRWRMYVGGGLGMASNLQAPKTHHGAGVVRLEYGMSKAFNRFTFSSAIAIENTFGNSLAIENKYVSYDLKRNDNRQVYNYNRFTNFMVPIRLGYFVGKSQRSHIQLVAMPAFTIYNNLVYREFSNENLVAKDEYFNQDVALNRFFVNVGIGYDFMITNNCSLGFEYNNNLGLNRKKSLSSAYTAKSDHQFIIQLRYFIR